MQVRMILAAAVVMGIGAQAQAWEPEGTVEFVVPYSAGGGSDVNARMLAETWRANDIVDANVVVLNKPGGSGAVGNTYAFSKTGNPNTLMTFIAGQMMSTISNDAAVKLENVTPLATLSVDTLVLVTRSADDFADFDALVAAASAEPNSITIGGVSRGSEDHLVFTMLSDSLDAELQYVPFDGGGDALSALLGGHVDAAIFNPSEIGQQVAAGRAHPLGAFSEERLSEPFDSTATFAELGYPGVAISLFRGYAGPPEMPAEAVAYWEEKLKAAYDTEMWQQDYIQDKGLVARFMGAEESAEFYAAEAEKYERLLKAAGFID
ncbi:MAG TPA: tripartite tricarboxylate transporter substrate binding protein [Citreicella sp.]|nr:tripartite tricarboxylate transporter substrate binding protein [Citreicella sp.]